MLGLLKKKLLKEELEALHNKLGKAFFLIEQDIKKMSNWAGTLENKHKELKKSHISHMSLTGEEISKLKKWMKDIYDYNSNLKTYLDEVNIAIKSLYDEQKRLREKVSILQQKHQESGVSDPGKASEKPKAAQEKAGNKASNTLNFIQQFSGSDRLVMDILYKADKPLTYYALAEKTKLNYGTIKNIIYRLRKKGLEIFDQKTPEGEKEFFLPTRVKIEISGR